MIHEYTNEKVNSIIGLTENFQSESNKFSIQEGIVNILWNRNDSAVKLEIDSMPIILESNHILTTTYLHRIKFEKASSPLVGIIFNREFYCILDHDEEVSCNGILFFGSQDIAIISLDKNEQEKFDVLLKVFIDEFETNDTIQGEMLQMMLKRFIIKCVRLAKVQHINQSLNNQQIDLIRQYNLLVDMHYKNKRLVKDYAELLNKSPKTLSNVFSLYGQKSPQQIITDRLTLEAKRLLVYTDKNMSEIGFELGFEDPAYFSRFFKKHTDTSPKSFRENSSF